MLSRKEIKTRDNIQWRSIKNKLFLGTIITLSIVTISPIVLIISELIKKGYKQLNFNFFTQTTPDTWDAMTAIANGEVIPGGILNGLLGTLLMVTMAAAMAIPVGIIIGIYLYEKQDKIYANLVRSLSDIIQGVPSIVLGLIAYMWVVKPITGGFSALAGSAALAIMMLPLIIRSTEESMKMIPGTLKEAAYALGTPYHKVILKVLIPSSLSGLTTGILLAISRIIGETAPLLLTTLGNPAINFNVAKPTSALPLLIWEFYNDPNMVDMIWGTSLFLMIFILILNFTTKQIAAKKKIQ